MFYSIEVLLSHIMNLLLAVYTSFATKETVRYESEVAFLDHVISQFEEINREVLAEPSPIFSLVDLRSSLTSSTVSRAVTFYANVVLYGRSIDGIKNFIFQHRGESSPIIVKVISELDKLVKNAQMTNDIYVERQEITEDFIRFYVPILEEFGVEFNAKQKKNAIKYAIKKDVIKRFMHRLEPFLEYSKTLSSISQDLQKYI
jgi:hypothetical protein